jgi:hypothetical protein
MGEFWVIEPETTGPAAPILAHAEELPQFTLFSRVAAGIGSSPLSAMGFERAPVSTAS